MMPAGYFDTYHDTDAEIISLAGLTAALGTIARESKAIAHTDSDSRQIMALISVIEDKTAALEGMHAAEWEAVKAQAEAP